MSVDPRARAFNAPSRHVYDVVVIGSHLGGAVAAALLQRRGLHVLYVEHDGTGTGYAHDGWLLPYAPFVLPGLKACAALEEAFTELGLNTLYSRTAHASSPMLQLILKDARLDMSVDPKAREREAKRWLDEKATGFLADWESAAKWAAETEPFFKEKPDLHPDGMMASWQFKRVLSRYANLTQSAKAPDNDVSKLLYALGQFAVNVVDREQLASTRPLSMLLHGLYSWPFGREGLRDVLLHRLAELGGDVLTHDGSTVIEEISFDGSHIAGIKLLRSDVVYKTHCIIGATDAPALRRLIPDKKKHRALAELLDGPTARQVLFSVNWVVSEKAMPKGMGELLMIDPVDTTLSPLLVQVTRSRKAPGEAAPPEDERVITAGMFVDANLRDLGENQVQDLVQRISNELDALMPFTKAKAKLISAPYLSASGVRGSRMMPHPLMKLDESAWLGVTGLPVKAPAKHMFFASREVLPGLGLEGEILAALRACKMTQEVLKKPNVLPKG